MGRLTVKMDGGFLKGMLQSGVRHALEITDGLPEDAKIVKVSYDVQYNLVEFEFESDSAGADRVVKPTFKCFYE